MMETKLGVTTEPKMASGLYSVGEAARLIRVPENSVRQWVSGRPSRAHVAMGDRPSRENSTPSVLVSPPVRVGGDVVLTFAHLIELRMVRLFRGHGVSMPTIKAAARSAARLLNTQHPFSSFKLQTDGKRIFADLSVQDVSEGNGRITESQVVQDLAQLQIVMGDIARIYFKDMDYEEEMAARWWLLGRGRRAVLDPQRGFGQPLDDETGVPLSVLYDLIYTGEDTKAVMAWYDVDEPAIETAVEFYDNYLLGRKF